jgi:hypothetical protein
VEQIELRNFVGKEPLPLAEMYEGEHSLTLLEKIEDLSV